ncbi:Acyl_transf_3 domain-containing protein [Caenorhabditis elegans]|uniref:Acyl_transf_3 domain-containing protein n=1 Tax=Caenorhabditis elegans TaxID=6239 RepID=O02307_CAEEL|nr:Acyl_transf_3 domain-containing protein [Caenorhabditis elegans]CAB03534.1 Acyl_transf_3 domain-containing protein [Caenorhabditis elegans]|eukprot:NP_493127.1 O-ACyltransferase homolog [Caenorhabditis elegans]
MSTKVSSKRQDLQAVRGLAILSVLGFHFYPNQFPNGYLGVDQFFVLSGFLMCMLLSKTSNMSIPAVFLHFYTRRLKRILPMYFFAIFLALIALYTAFSVTNVLQNQYSALRALFFTSNRKKTGFEDYFEMLDLAVDIFTHTWSLSVEVQFYLIVPVVFMIGDVLSGNKQLGYYYALCLSSLIYYLVSPPDVSFNSVFARSWQFLIGMVVHLKQRRESSIPTNEPESEKLLENVSGEDISSIAWVRYSFILPMISLAFFKYELPSTLMRLIFTIFTGCFILYSVDDDYLENRFLTYIGDISYTLYLVHWPVYAYCKLSYPESILVLTIGLITSILFSVVLYETFEKWYLNVSNVNVAILVVSLFTANLILIYKDNIFDSTKLSMPGNSTRLDGVTDDMDVYDAIRLNAYWHMTDLEGLKPPGCNRKWPGKNWCDFEMNGTEFKLAVLGNSYVENHLKMFIQECGYRSNSLASYTENACEPLAAYEHKADCKSKLKNFIDFLETTQPDYAFILTRFFATGVVTNSTSSTDEDPIYLEMREQMGKLLPNIKKKLYILDAFPRPSMVYILQVAKDLKNGRNVDEIHKDLVQFDTYKLARQRTEAIVKECGNKCELIDYEPLLFNKTSNRFEFFDSRGFLYFTIVNHLSAHGVELIRPIYTKICQDLR